MQRVLCVFVTMQDRARACPHVCKVALIAVHRNQLAALLICAGEYLRRHSKNKQALVPAEAGQEFGAAVSSRCVGRSAGVGPATKQRVAHCSTRDGCSAQPYGS